MGTDDKVLNKKSTIKDVAAEANVSISTVSLVMNDKGNVSSDTRSRVLQTAQRLGYIPTQAARRLASRRTGNIGFVLRDDHFTRSEPFYTRIFLGTEFEARLKNVYVLLTTIPKAYTPGTHTPRFLQEQNVDGVIVAGKVDTAFLEEVQALDLPTVLVDFEAMHFPAVVIDNQAGAFQAVTHLIERGHERIAFLGADMDHPSLRARLDGYRVALGRAGVAFDPSLIITTEEGGPTRRIGMHLAEVLLASPTAPTAVFCANDALALGVMDKARQHGVSIPKDLAVVGFDNVPTAANADPALTTIRVFKEQMGELALRTLADLIEDAPQHRDRYERRGHTITIATELVIRASS